MTKRSHSRSKSSPDSSRIPLRGRCTCCWVQRAEDQGCVLELPPRAHLCLSGTLYQQNHQWSGKLCDHVVFWLPDADTKVGVVELKSKNPSTSEVQKQLQGGSDLAARLLPQVATEFVAAVLHQGMNSMGLKSLASKKVTFRGKRHRIVQKRCGTAFQRLF